MALTDGKTTEPSVRSMVQSLRLDKNALLGGIPSESPMRPKLVIRKRWLLVLPLLAALATSIVLAQRSGHLFAQPRVRGTRITAESSLNVLLETSGYIVPSTTTRVSSELVGTAVEIGFEVGEWVSAGQILVKLDDTHHQAALVQAEAAHARAKAVYDDLANVPRKEEVEQARAALAKARAVDELAASEFERARRLGGTISPREIARARAAHSEAVAGLAQATHALRLLEAGPTDEQFTAARAEVQRTKALLDQAQYAYDHTSIRAPHEGTVLEANVGVGEMVRPDHLGAPLCVIADISELEVEVDIQERDAAVAELGRVCLVNSESDPNNSHIGELSWLAPTFNRQRGVRGARIRLHDSEGLCVDMNCRVRLLSDPIESLAGQEKLILAVPEETVVKSDNGDAKVFVLEGDIAREREIVEAGRRNGRVLVVSGVEENQIVLASDKPLQDGQRVTAVIE